MPHISVKMYPGKSDQEKSDLAAAITQALITTVNASENAVSVTIEDVQPGDWMEQVYKPDITDKTDRLYKRPGYGPST